MKLPKVLITIDPGSTNGGMAMWMEGQKIQVKRMPKSDEMERLSEFFDYAKETFKDVVVFIEQISMFLGSEDAANVAKQYRLQKLKANYEHIVAFLIHKKIPYVPVHPISWQSSLKLRKKWKSDQEKKNAFKAYAAKCFPAIKVTLWNSDALCLVQFALLKYANDKAWIKEKILNEQKNKLF